MKFTFHPHARKELREVAAHYDSVDVEAGESFLEEISKSIIWILSFPEACAKIRGEVRRCSKSLSMWVVYEIGSSHIFILAVMHLRRKPDYWSYRE